MSSNTHNLYPVYCDFALVLAWPDTTARGDHKWCDWLKKSGLLKNKNFKVGHAAIILIQDTGELHYFDFGRYVTPRGFGRARSKNTDPKLTLKTSAVFAKESDERAAHDSHQKLPANKRNIQNLDEIINELESKKAATHGNGPLYFSIVDNFDFELGYEKADDFVKRGSMIYSAFAPGNSNCSRFVESVLIAGLPGSSRQRRNLMIHETIVSSPISNVVNASCDGYVYCALNGDIEPKKMSRLESMWFFIQKTISNFRTDLAKDLPDDSVYGHTYEPARPAHIPTDAKWLGGIGEGGWFHLELNPLSNPLLTKFGSDGEVEFERQVISTTLDHNKPLHITYDTHASKLTIIQNGTTKEFELEEIPNLETSDTTRGTNIINNKDQINITNALQHSEI